MDMTLALYMYAATCGFVAAGLLGSFYQAVTEQPPQFRVSYDSALRAMSSTLFSVFAAPYIVMRNAIRGRRIERRPIGWLLASALIAALWSTFSGIVVIELALVIGDRFV